MWSISVDALKKVVAMLRCTQRWAKYIEVPKNMIESIDVHKKGGRYPLMYSKMWSISVDALKKWSQFFDVHKDGRNTLMYPNMIELHRCTQNKVVDIR
ncbi:hypothetical protein CEXT_20921 [Caerostris extrusa]|uniref:Uncharacterized protein n=1 Tax=Caerostris extrusa TaxID=172846 RepID=A0AAV4RGE7_CAEEX|nr:hypothetical protein CEXT_20921 [Caerostris extrusa]